MITELQFKDAAAIIGCETASVKSVYEVETAGKGFLNDGRIKILFEGHRFWKQLVKAGGLPAAYLKNNPQYSDVLYENWDRKKYVGGSGEWDRMSKAIEVCRQLNVSAELALCSASYGSFQILGENHTACGYDSAQEMIAKYNLGGEAEQLNSFVRFVKSNHLDDGLISKNWKAFAKGYNGTQYLLNRYDSKLYIAYLKFR